MSVSYNHKSDSTITFQSQDPKLKLYDYNELLGQWPEREPENLDETANSFQAQGQAAENNDNYDDDAESAFPTGQYYNVLAKEERPNISDNIHPVRVSQIPNPHLKYNTALALTFPDITILNHSSACLSYIVDADAGLVITNGIVDMN